MFRRLAVLLAVLVAVGTAISLGRPEAASAVYIPDDSDKHARWETSPAFGADGGRGKWYLRAMTAPDAFTGGSYPLTFRYFLRSELDQTICV